MDHDHPDRLRLEGRLLPGSPEQTLAAPHPFDPLARRDALTGNRCKGCHLVRSLHPTLHWTGARALGDRRRGLSRPLGMAAPGLWLER